MRRQNKDKENDVRKTIKKKRRKVIKRREMTTEEEMASSTAAGVNTVMRGCYIGTNISTTKTNTNSKTPQTHSQNCSTQSAATTSPAANKDNAIMLTLCYLSDFVAC